MGSKIIPLLLFIFGGIFILILTLLIITHQDDSLSFEHGIEQLETSGLKLSQSSQSKEEIIKKSMLYQRSKNHPTPVDPNQHKNHSPGGSVQPARNPAHLIQEYQKKLDSTYMWGTYKPHLMHAITQRSTKPLTFGLIYVSTESNSVLTHSYRDIKRSKNQYTEYLRHDGKTYSESVFRDEKCSMEIHNHFYKERMQEDRQRWHSVTKKDKSGVGFLNNKASLIYYFMIEDFDGENDDRYLELDSERGVIKVKSLYEGKPSGYFKIVVYDKNDKALSFKDVEKYIYVDTTTNKKDTWKVQEILQRKMTIDPDRKFKVVPDNYESLSNSQTTNLIAVQLVLDPYASFMIHIIYDKLGGFENVEDNYSRAYGITRYSKTQFEPDFEEVFSKGNSIDPRHYTCGASALSNLLSGIGFYHGNIQVGGGQTSEQPKLSLYTGTPSKTEFPRGFLWDEGFHGMVYCKWNMEICIDVLRHWMNTQLDNGWIPREQLRGQECESYGNPEFITQVKDEANPPTIMFNVKSLVDLQEKGRLPDGAMEVLNSLYPKLKKWFEWFYATQASEGEEGLFTWRSNKQNSGLVLGSGLDDYPRGLEWGGKKPRGHLDLQVWMAFMADTMAKVAQFAGKPDDAESMKRFAIRIKNGLDKFLDEKDHIYKDLVTDERGEKGFSPHFGYVNLFPLFFGYIDKGSKNLDALLDNMKNSMKIWSAYGLLSLAKDDPLYMQTRDAYWGGPIWININYLALRGLKLYYYDNPKARGIYEELRANIIRNVCFQKETREYFFEQYNQDHGRGQKNYPFSGWTTTVLLMIYEKY